MAAVFDDDSLIQDVDAVAVHHGTDTMANQNDRVIGLQRIQSVDDDLFVFGVESAGRLVEHKDRSCWSREYFPAPAALRDYDSSYVVGRSG
jgi:hypothetical protein